MVQEVPVFGSVLKSGKKTRRQDDKGKKTQGQGHHDTANGSRRCWLTEEVVV